MPSNLKVHFSSKTDQWSTPQWLFDELNAEYGPFDLDVCADAFNHKVDTWIDVEGNGLTASWRINDEFWGRPIERPAACWMNPPYGREIGKWVKKAYEESLRGCLVVCLLPARTDTKWFHEYCTKGKIEFLKGRLKFGDAKNSAPFPSMVVVFSPAKEKT